MFMPQKLKKNCQTTNPKTTNNKHITANIIENILGILFKQNKKLSC